MRFLAALLLLAAPAMAQMTALPEPIQARIRAIGPTMGAAGVASTGEALRPAMPATPPPSLRDASYGPDPRNRLDVWTSAGIASPVPGSIPSPVPGRPARPVLVFVHGGGFLGGDKSRPGVFYYDNIAAWAAGHGMVGVNLTYRLAPAHTYPAVVEDIAAALAWLRANIAAHGGDPARIILMGQSAGAAHVADYLAAHADAPGVAAAVLVSGVYQHHTRMPETAYYGAAGATHSSLPGLARLRIPVLASIAELEPQGFREHGLALRAALPAARFLDLAGHNHFSTVFAIGSADAGLSGAILELAQRSRN